MRISDPSCPSFSNLALTRAGSLTLLFIKAVMSGEGTLGKKRRSSDLMCVWEEDEEEGGGGQE